MTTTPTVQQALEALRSAIEAEHAHRILASVQASLNGHAPSQPKRRITSAGRARQIAGSKAYWARVRLATKARAK